MVRRRHLDFYETNASAVLALRRRVAIKGIVYEPCNGLGAISKMFGDCRVITSDINPAMPADNHCRAQDIPWWAMMGYAETPRWVVTNPPFSEGVSIVRPVVEANLPCAFLLRLSFAEPTRDPKDANYRGEWLSRRPPAGVIVLPRHSYTGDGAMDSVTSAWFLWNCKMKGPAIQCAPEGETDESYARTIIV